MSRTSHYDLNRINSSGSLADDSYKYGTTDRDTIDQKLYEGAEGHHHTGTTIDAPGAAPTLAVVTDAGSLAAGTTYYYKYSLVDSSGNESAAGDQASVTTAPAVVAPGAPTLSTQGTGGVLTSGNYTYVLSAYVGDSQNETLASNSAFITVASGSTNQVTITYPSLPSGATGFNIYRRVPSGSMTEFLLSVDMSAATPPSSYVDTGSVTGDCYRTTPLRNRTSISSAVRVSLPGATPVTPAGHTWKIYRTTVSGSYTSSFLHHVVEYTAEATPTVTPTYLDTGIATTTGSPSSEGTGSPSKILLTDGAEVQGELPAANISYFPYEIVFSFADTLVAQAGQFIWFCPFTTATIVGVRATLGAGAKPAGQAVIVDVRKGAGAATPTFFSIFTNPTLRPAIPVGRQYSDLATPNVTSLARGDMLITDISQAGGGATPTDKNLTVSILLRAKFA